MKSFQKRLKYIKLCLISPALEIVINIIYIVSFIIIFIYFFLEGKYYNDNQILKFAESYIDYNTFNGINEADDFMNYLSSLVNKLYTIDINNKKLPIFIPLNPIRLSQFSNKGCKEEDFTYSCNKNFRCVINSLATSFKHLCGLRYTNKIEEFNLDEIEEDDFDIKKKKKRKNFFGKISYIIPWVLFKI